MRFVGVFNRDGGTFRTMDPVAFSEQATSILAEAGHSLDCRFVDHSELAAALTAAAERLDADAMLVGGGDGTVSAAARAAFASKRPLAVLPAGTMNLFAHSLGLPLDLPGALRAIARGTVQEVDVASANGRVFVHLFSVGIHPRLVHIRERMTYRSRLGKIAASLQSVMRAIKRPPRFEAEIGAAQGRERRLCSSIIVSNNPLGEGAVPFAPRLDGGVLGIYITPPMTAADMSRLLVDVLLGRWRDSPLVAAREYSELTLGFPHKKVSAEASIDGELIPLDTRVELKIHPRSLKVIAPARGPALPG